MESKWQRKRREHNTQLKTDNELPKVTKESTTQPAKEAPPEREVRTDAE